MANADSSTKPSRKCAIVPCVGKMPPKGTLCNVHRKIRAKQKIIESGLICSVGSCDKPIKTYTSGLCQAHLFRFKKYGDPLAGQTGNGEPLAWLRRMVTNLPLPNTCIIWPYALNGLGYGHLSLGFGVQHKGAHRVALAFHQGLTLDNMPPTDVETRHLCPNGPNRACVNPLHLKFGTHAENMADIKIHGSQKGSKNPMSKLTEHQVAAILSDPSPTKALVEKYGISRSGIDAIRARKLWSHVNPADYI